MSGIIKRAGRAVGLGGLAVAMAAAVALPATAGATATSPSPDWTASTAPVSGLSPAVGAAYDQDAVLADLACPAAGSCVAVGNYQDGQGNGYALTEVQSGGAWQAATAPLAGLNPAPAANPQAKLTALSCPKAGFCVAVGSYRISATEDYGLIETLSGGLWTAEAAPAPAGGSNALLQSVSCPSAGWCVAIGTTYAPASGNGPLAETLSNGMWTPSALPDGDLSLGAGDFPSLLSVSCSGAGSCVAVGSFMDSHNYTWPVVATLDAGTWSLAQPSVSQVNPTVSTSAALTQVSCTSDGFCAAVGAYSGGDNHTDALVATRSAGSWSVLAAPETGLAPARETGRTSNESGPIMDVNRVQCPASGSCVAVGEYVDVNGIEDGLAETLSNGTWSARTLPMTGLSPAPSNVRSMTRVSCATSSWCVAIGTYEDNSGGETGLTHGMFETLSNGTWTATTAPVTGLNPGPNAVGYSEFSVPVSPNAIVCETAGSCVSVGYYEDVSDTVRGLIETLGATAGGYWLTSSAGNVWNFNAPWYGSEAGKKLPAPVVGISADGDGYLLVTKAGNVYNFNTPWYGSEAGKTLPAPVVGIAADPVTGGYWLVTSAGSVYNFNAPAYGPTAGTKLSAPVAGITSEGDGFLLATSDGNVYNYNVPAYGSQAGHTLAAPVDGIGIDPATGGYWLITGVGNVWNFNAPWSGSEVGQKLPAPVVGITAEGDGYLLTSSAGNVWNFNAPWSGSEVGQKLPAPVVGIATAG